jgi:hypothetical protein
MRTVATRTLFVSYTSSTVWASSAAAMRYQLPAATGGTATVVVATLDALAASAGTARAGWSLMSEASSVVFADR